MLEEVKPVNPKRGWKFQHLYVDEAGQVFRKGVHCPSETADSIKAELEQNAVSKQQKVVSQETPVEKEVKQVVKEQGKEDLLKTIMKQNEMFAQSQQQIAEVLKAMANGNPDQAKFAKEISNAIKMSKTTDVSRKMSRRVDEIEEEDVLTPPVTFTAHSNGYVVYDYYGKNGQPVVPPYGGIFEFKRAGGKKIKNGNDEQMLSFCTITIHSLKEKEYLEGHPSFGLAFFNNNSRTALSMTHNIVQTAAEMYNKINTWDKQQVLNIARTRPDMLDKIGMPIGDLKTALAVSYAEEIMKERDVKSLENAKAMRMDNLIPPTTK